MNITSLYVFFSLKLSVTSHRFMCNFDFNIFYLIFLIFHVNYLRYKNIHIFTFNTWNFLKKSKLCFKPSSLKWRISEYTYYFLDLLGIEKVQSDSICEDITQESKALCLDSYDLQLLHLFSVHSVSLPEVLWYK